jgi:hypothetical protein
MPGRASQRVRGIGATAAVLIGLSAASCRIAAVEIDIAATAAKYGPSASASAAGGAVEVSSELLARDQEDYAHYVQWQRAYARRGWEWHLFSTQVLFAMVMAIVIFGLWLTHKQFQRDYVAHDGAPSAEPTPAPAPSPSTLKLGPAGLELTSQVVGLLVLAISVAFFYFYVKEVYPMREVERDTAALTSTPAK